jgi:SAM-dependent methyltransferase
VDGYGASTYGDGIADVYDDWYARTDDLDTAVEHLHVLAAGGRVLELAIGTGRLALPLAARGVAVEGVDASAAMVARMRAKPGGELIPVVIGDMAGDLPAGPFRLVFVAFNSFFGLLTADAQQRCFQAVAERLEPEGSFVIEAFVPQPPSPGSRVEVRRVDADRLVLMATLDHPDEQRSEGHLVELSEAGGVRLRPWAVRWAFPDELDAMATAAGLELEGRSADWRGAPFDEESPAHVSCYRPARRAGVPNT